jgi:phosphoribosylformimino-5-aminoimidazole carboxamide ribotide isomerase
MVKLAVTRGFELLAAIDLRGGRVVRLRQGDFERETSFSDDPLAVAERFVVAGAPWLHVVDLDGARAGEPAQIDQVAGIVGTAAGRASVEVSGGLRSAGDVKRVLDRGARRVAIGTAAVEDPAFVEHTIQRHGADRIAIAVDIREGVAIGRGWRTGSPGTDPEGLVRRLAAAGATTFEVTAIDRDGLAAGPNLRLLEALVGLGLGRVIASGGIRDGEDLAAVARIGCVGAIVGRALYDGSLTIGDALEAVAQR